MVSSDAAQVLLSGPRGRRLCAELVPWPVADGSVSSFAFQAQFLREGSMRARHQALLDELPSRVGDACSGDRRSLLAALADTVARARYWQEPEDVDVALDSAEARRLLVPVADRVVEQAPWLWDELVVDDQYFVLTRGDHTFPADALGAGLGISRWRRAAVVTEARELPRRLRPATAAYSGTWWSTPAMADCPQSTRSVGVSGAVDVPLHLLLQEDGLGEVRASTRRMRSRGGARVLEIRCPGDWIDLVQQHPMVVTRSRTHDWYRTTGRIGAWAQPDWAAVTASYDAVHLTVAGYLSTAGRALTTGLSTPEGQAATVLAGWDPDSTWWFSDKLEPTGPIQQWQRGEDALDWSPVMAPS